MSQPISHAARSTTCESRVLCPGSDVIDVQSTLQGSLKTLYRPNCLLRTFIDWQSQSDGKFSFLTCTTVSLPPLFSTVKIDLMLRNISLEMFPYVSTRLSRNMEGPSKLK